MTALALASALNALSVFFVAAVSWVVARRHPAAFFRHWIWAHVLEGLVMVVDAVAAAGLGHPTWLTCLQATLVAWSVYHLVQCARGLRGLTLGRVGTGLLFAFFLLPSFVLAALGQPHTTLVIFPVLGIVVALFYLGAVFLLDRGLRTGLNLGWIAVPEIVRALATLSYPLVVGSDWSWAYYVAAIGFHLVTGTGMVLLLVDRVIADLHRKNAELRHLDELKNNFLSNVSHELRTPLAVIGGTAEIIKLDQVDPVYHAGVIERHVQQLGRLVDDLLDFTHMKAGQFQTEREPIELAALVRECAEEIRARADERGVTLAIAVHEDRWVSADPRRLAQAVLQLLDNALKFTPPGGHVRLGLDEAEGEVRLEVTDTGPGIAPEHLGRIFDRFYQVDGSSTRAANGLGLGLAITRHIVEAGHGGRLEVESAPGVGTTFRLALPALAPPATEGAERLRPAAEPA